MFCACPYSVEISGFAVCVKLEYEGTLRVAGVVKLVDPGEIEEIEEFAGTKDELRGGYIVDEEFVLGAGVDVGSGETHDV